MNPSPETTSTIEPGDREQQALDWFTRVRADDLSAAEQLAFAQWHQQRENARAFAELEQFWQQLELPARRVRRAEYRPAKRPWRRLAVAACIMLVSGLLVLQLPTLQRLNSDYATSAGERRHLRLADDTLLVLDSASAVDVDLRGPVRKIRLVQGQLFLDVSHDGRPFVVEVDGAQVQVLGTRFSVSRAKDHDEVVLLKGKVEVSNNGQKRMLDPGQRVTFNNQRLDAVQAVDAERLTAWRDGQLRVREVPLRQVLEQLAGYQGARLVLLDEQVGRRLVSGSFNLDKADNALDALAQSQDLNIHNLAGQLILVR